MTNNANTNNTTITITLQSGFTDTTEREPAWGTEYEAPDHVTVTAYGGRSLGFVGTPDGGTYEQFIRLLDFAGCRAGDVIRTYPWTHETRVYKTKKGLVFREYPRIYPR